MHHVILERWSRRQSPLHARDARVKVLAALALLVLIATTPPTLHLAFEAYALLLVAAIGIARLPLFSVLARAGFVLPFSLVFALVSWLGGDPARGLSVIVRSLLSSAAVLTLVSTTRLPDLLRAFEWFRIPALLILIAQFLYRYLFVLSEQAQHMRLAASCRSGTERSRRASNSRFRAAAGALTVLFSRSYQRAEGVHQAMLARGFQGHFPALSPSPVTLADLLFLAVSVGAPLAIRLTVHP